MKLVRLVFPIAITLLLGASRSVGAYDSTKVCALLTPQELTTAGITLTAQGLMAGEPQFVPKGIVPGLVTDLQANECTSEMAVEYTAFPVRWSVTTSKDRIDRATWNKMSDALDGQEKKIPDPAEQQFVIEGMDCETFSWLAKGGKRIYAMSCTGHKEFHHVTLEFAHGDRAKLPPAKTVKQLLDKILARL
jgi:hypothetical protein